MFAKVQSTAYPYRTFDAPWIRLAISFRDLVLLMDAPYVGIHLMSRATEFALGMRPAEHANSREFAARFSLFVHGENHVSVIDPASKKEVR